MAGEVPPRTGVCVIRAWVEDGPSPGLRVVITHTPDIAVGDRTTSHAGTVPDALDVVASWFEVLRSHRSAGGEDRRR